MIFQFLFAKNTYYFNYINVKKKSKYLFIDTVIRFEFWSRRVNKFEPSHRCVYIMQQ